MLAQLLAVAALPSPEDCKAVVDDPEAVLAQSIGLQGFIYGYTHEWPVEQALRDARVLTIFEGATGIQAMDLTHRRLLADESSYRVFLSLSGSCSDARFKACIAELDAAATWLKSKPTEADGGATAFLHLAALAALSWIAAGYVDDVIDDPFLRVAADHWLDTVVAKAAALRSRIEAGAALAARFQALAAL